jgi:hypothetical protein
MKAFAGTNDNAIGIFAAEAGSSHDVGHVDASCEWG